MLAARSRPFQASGRTSLPAHATTICCRRNAAAVGRPFRVGLRCSAALDPRLVGTWDKDMSRSTSMDDVADLVGLSGLVREGIKLIRGCELSVNGSTFTMGVFSVLPIVKINEQYPLNGAPASNNRRDLRWGKATGVLSVAQPSSAPGNTAAPALGNTGTSTGSGCGDGGGGSVNSLPVLRLRWEGPYAGSGVDTFSLVGDHELHVTSSVTVGGKTVSYTSVHTRRR